MKIVEFEVVNFCIMSEVAGIMSSKSSVSAMRNIGNLLRIYQMKKTSLNSG